MKKCKIKFRKCIVLTTGTLLIANLLLMSSNIIKSTCIQETSQFRTIDGINNLFNSIQHHGDERTMSKDWKHSSTLQMFIPRSGDEVQFNMSSRLLQIFNNDLNLIVSKSDPEHVLQPFFMSPAIWEEKDGSYGLVARVELRVNQRAVTPPSRNILITQRYSPQFKVIQQGHILGILHSEGDLYAGPVDPRSITVAGEHYIIFNMLTFKNKLRQMYIYSYIKEDLKKLEIYQNNEIIPLEKDETNWTPFLIGNDLYLIYGMDPLVVLHCNISSGACKIVHKSVQSFQLNADELRVGALRGGTPFVLYKYPYYVSLGHATSYKMCHGKRFYSAHLIIMSIEPNFRIVSVSDSIQLHQQILTMFPKLKHIANIANQFFFPTSLLIRENNLDVAGHVNDNGVVMLQFHGMRTIIDHVIAADTMAQAMSDFSDNQQQATSIHNFIHNIHSRGCLHLKVKEIIPLKKVKGP